MNQEKKSYQSIFKATSLFGGVQVVQIMISIIRSKAIALFLGPAGMGIAGLLNSGLQMVQQLSSFGLDTSAIKDVSAAYAEGDQEKMGKTISVFRKWIWVTGMLGLVLVVILSPVLSITSFDNYEYVWAFIAISVTLLLNQLKTGQTVLLRAMRRIKDMARGSVVGSALALLLTLPLYYFFGLKGIVPAIILTSLIGWFVMRHFASKIHFEELKISWKESWKEGKGMLRMGFHLSIAGIIAGIGAYALRAYLSQFGSMTEVGFYVAGFAIINSYVGMIFNAMGTDYFPRLSGFANNLAAFKECINHQAEIALLILGPILCFFVVFLKFGVLLLYSADFLPIVKMLQWAALGVLFKAGSWPLSFALLAKGDSFAFLSFEGVVHVLLFVLSAVFYSIFGLDGLGMGYLMLYIIYMIGLVMITGSKYNFRYTRSYLTEFFVLTLAVIGCFVGAQIFSGIAYYLFGSAICVLASIFSLFYLQQRIDLRQLLHNWRRK